MPRDVVVEIDHRPPDRVAVVVGAVADVVLGDLPQDVVAAAAVVEDQVENDGDAVAMRRVDQLLELIGRAVGRFDGVEEGRVVAPADVARELVDWQQLNGGDAEFIEVVVAAVAVEFLGDPLERRQRGVAVREPQRMQLVDLVVFPAWPRPSLIMPSIIGTYGDQRARAQVRTLDPARRRILRRGIGAVPVGQHEAVAVASARRARETPRGTLPPPELAVGSASQVERARQIVGEVTSEAHPRDLRPGVDDGVPGAALLIKARRPLPDRRRVAIEPTHLLSACGNLMEKDGQGLCKTQPESEHRRSSPTDDLTANRSSGVLPLSSRRVSSKGKIADTENAQNPRALPGSWCRIPGPLRPADRSGKFVRQYPAALFGHPAGFPATGRGGWQTRGPNDEGAAAGGLDRENCAPV